MTEKDPQDTPKILDEIAKNNQATPGNKRRGGNGPGRLLLMSLLFVPLLLALLYLSNRLTVLQSELTVLNETNQGLREQLGAQGSQLQSVQERLALPPEPVPVDDSSVRALEAAVNGEFTDLDRRLNELRTQQEVLAQAPNFEWKVMEAEYLLATANRKLMLEGDVDTAMAMAEEADRALLDSGNRNVFATRQEISTALAGLANSDALDREGVYLRIANLDRQVAQINLLASMRQSFDQARNADSQPVDIAAAEEGFGASFYSFLSSVFVLREWEETPDAMLAPGQESQVKQSLRLFLAGAQLALLQRDAEMYQRSLSDAEDWLQRFKVTETNVGQSMTAEIAELKAIDIDPQLGSFEQALTRIRQIPQPD